MKYADCLPRRVKKFQETRCCVLNADGYRCNENGKYEVERITVVGYISVVIQVCEDHLSASDRGKLQNNYEKGIIQ